MLLSLFMQFYYPAVLWALGALALPVLIHLFNLRPSRRLDFSHLPILKEAVSAAKKRRKLRYRVVLLCRLLALACIVLAFAQPYLQGEQALPRSRDVALCVDNSYSMSRMVATNERALAVALFFAQKIVLSYDERTRFVLVTNDSAPLRSYARQEMLDKLATITYSSRGRTAQQWQSALRPLETDEKGFDVYWLSDFQANMFEKPLSSDTLHRWRIFPLRSVQSDNLFIDTAYSTTPVWVAEQPNRICFRLQNSREVACDPCTVSLVVEGVQEALQTAFIAPNQSGTLCFDYKNKGTDGKRIYAQVDDPNMPFDNRFYLALNISPVVSVAEVVGKEASDAVAQVFSENTRFKYKRYTIEAPEIEQSIFFQSSYEQLYKYDLLILHALPKFSPALVNIIDTFLGEGKVVLCVPSEGADLSSYALSFPGFSADLRAKEQDFLAVLDYASSFYAQVFTRAELSVAMPKARQRYVWNPPDRRVQLQFSSGAPFLSSSTLGGSGTCYLLATTLSDLDTDFAKHVLFLPTFYKIAAQAQSNAEHLYYRTNVSHFQLSTSRLRPSSELFSLRNVEGESRTLSTQARGDRHFFFLGDTVTEAGFYQLKVDKNPLLWLAFNMPAKESVLQTLSEEALSEWIEPLRQSSIDFTPTTDQEYVAFKKQSMKTPLWRYFVVASLLLLLAEAAFLRYFWRHEVAH